MDAANRVQNCACAAIFVDGKNPNEERYGGKNEQGGGEEGRKLSEERFASVKMSRRRGILRMVLEQTSQKIGPGVVNCFLQNPS